MRALDPQQQPVALDQQRVAGEPLLLEAEPPFGDWYANPCAPVIQ